MRKKIILIFTILLCLSTIPIMAQEDYTSDDILYEEMIEDTDSDSDDESTDVNSYFQNKSSYVYQNEETKYTVVIEDDANLLSEEEEEKLKVKMIPLTEHGHIIFKSIDSNYTTTENYASSYYHSNFSTQSGTLFLIDMNNRNIYIFSDGDNYRSVTRSKAYSITDNTYRYATRGDYYSCAYYSFDQINSVLNGRKIAEPMRNASNVVVSITIALLINFLIVFYHSRIKKAKISEITKNCVIDFNIGKVYAEKTGTHRVYSPVSDSSSSGGGGGGGGGGGSSGGGGGHSF